MFLDVQLSVNKTAIFAAAGLAPPDSGVDSVTVVCDVCFCVCVRVH